MQAACYRQLARGVALATVGGWDFSAGVRLVGLVRFATPDAGVSIKTKAPT